MTAALLIALIVLGLPTLYFAWRSRLSQIPGWRILRQRGHSILFVPCQSVGAAARHQSDRDARNQRGALYCAFHLVRALSLLWLYQKT